MGSIAASVVVHVVLIAAVTAASGRPVGSGYRLEGPSPERIVHHALVFPHATAAPPAAGPRAAARSGGTGRRRPARRRAERPSPLVQLAKLTASLRQLDLKSDITGLIPIDAVSPDYARMASSGIDLGAGAFGGGIIGAIGSGYARPEANGAYRADVVDRMTWPRLGNPIPEYPKPMLRQGVEAAYHVTFVVDSTGRVEPGSISFPDEANELFVASILEALAGSRYYPATIGGRPVAQFVKQQFRFELVR